MNIYEYYYNYEREYTAAANYHCKLRLLPLFMTRLPTLAYGSTLLSAPATAARVLQVLSQVEVMLISASMPIMSIYIYLIVGTAIVYMSQFIGFDKHVTFYIHIGIHIILFVECQFP